MNRLPITKALRAAQAAATGKPVGLGGFPHVGGVQAAPPYSILYEIGGASFMGPPLLDDHADVSWVYQVTSVGGQPDQATWMADRVRRFWLSRLPSGDYETPIVIPGLSVMARAFDSDNGSDGEPDPERPVTSYVERYTITVTPAPQQ